MSFSKTPTVKDNLVITEATAVKTYSGTAAPTSSLGKDGDIYIQY